MPIPVFCRGIGISSQVSMTVPWYLFIGMGLDRIRLQPRPVFFYYYSVSCLLSNVWSVLNSRSMWKTGLGKFRSK